MIWTQRAINEKLGKNLIIWIRPDTVTHHVGSKRPLIRPLIDWLYRYPNRITRRSVRFLRRIHPFLIPAMLYPKPQEIIYQDKYILIEDLVKNREDIQNAQWYRLLLNELSSAGMARYKKMEMQSEDEIIRFLKEYVLDLIDSLAAEGYRHEKCTDYGTGIIGQNGVLHKSSSGDHRFCTAKIVGSRLFPLRIAGVHRDYFNQYRISKGDSDSIQCLLSLIREVEVNHK